MNLALLSRGNKFAPTGAAELIIDLVPQNSRHAPPPAALPVDALVLDAVLMRAEGAHDAASRAVEEARALLQRRGTHPTRSEVLEQVAAAGRALDRMSVALAALHRLT